MNYVQNRLRNLHTKLKNREVEAIIIQCNDSYFREYPAKCRKYGKQILSFTGLSGILTESSNDAALCSDSQYFIQSKKTVTAAI